MSDAVHIGTLTSDEHTEAMKWWADHAVKCPWAGGRKYAGAIGGVQSWHIVNTSIGQLISIHCTCGEEFLASRFI